MPLFRSKADLSVQLDQSAQALFTPGDAVSGRVVLHSPSDEHVSSISVSFLGKSKTYMTRQKVGPSNRVRTIYFRDRAPLFTYHTILFNGPYTLPANREHSWPFHFTFPTNTSENRHGRYESTHDSTWLTRLHPLPPSFHDESGTAYATISYVIQASLDRKHLPVTTDLPLKFSPYREASLLEPQMMSRESFSFASSRLQVGREEKRRSLKETFTDRFLSNTPYLEFSIAANLDRGVISGQDIALSLSLRVMKAMSTAEIVPSFAVRVREVLLKCYTQCRAMEDSTWPSFRSPEYQKLFESAVTLSHSLEGIVTTRSENGLSHPIALTAHVPTSICPNFRSYAINRTYQLTAKVRVQTAGKEFDAKFDVPRFTILPSVAAASTQGVADESSQQINTQEVAVPPYAQVIDLGDAGPSMPVQGSTSQEPVPAYDVGALPAYESSVKL